MNISIPVNLFPPLRLACHAAQEFLVQSNGAAVTFTEPHTVVIDIDSERTADRLKNTLENAMWFEPDASNKHLLETLARVVGLSKWADGVNSPDSSPAKPVCDPSTAH